MGFPEGVERGPLIPTLTLHPNVWFDGSRVRHDVAHFDCAGAGSLRGFPGKHGFVGSWDILTLCHRRWKMSLRLFFVLCPGLFNLSSVLRIGA